MIQLFNHYISGRLVALVVAEALVLLLAAYIGISMDASASGSALAASAYGVPSQAGVFALIMIVMMSSMGLYQAEVWWDRQMVTTRLLIAFLLCLGIFGTVSYFLIPFHYQRPLALGESIVAAGLVGVLLVRAVFSKWSGMAALKPRVLVLGTGSRVARLAESSERHPNHHLVGFVSLDQARHYVPLQNVLPMKPGDTLVSVVENHAVDQIVLGVRDRRSGGFPVQQLLECKTKGVKVMELSTFFEREYRQVLLESLNASWMVLGNGFRRGYIGTLGKRLFDLAVSTILLIFTLPIMAMTAACIALESGLPVLYRQERVGQGGRVFTLYKFRSMRTDAESKDGPNWAKANDDRATMVGKFIRKYRIDELPQIINVLRGEMSFVGPRPERPFFVDQLTGQIPFYALRHSAKPGITGWAQVRYPYGASVDDAIEKLQYDLYYVKNHSLFLDVAILMSTVEVVLWGKGAR